VRTPTRPSRPRGTLRGSPLFRLRLGFLLIAMVLSVFSARLVQLQGVDPKAYAEMAAASGTEEVVLPAERGDILDRNGEPLARSVEGLMVVGDPELTADQAPEIAQYLARRLDVDYFTVLPRLREEGSRFEYLARRVPSTVATKVVEDAEELGFEGLDTRRDPVRDYPADDVAANLVGFMGTDEALAGFERTFDAQLAGTDGSARYQVGGGNRIPLGENTVVAPHDGEDLHTTLDLDLQWYTQRVLRQTVEDAGAESGFAVVMDTKTGELLALADHPTFDASNPLVADKEDLGSRALNDVYEPGSVEKVMTVAGLLDAGKVTPRTRIVVQPELHRDGRTIGDWFDHGVLRLTMAGVIALSSNIGTVRAADEYDRGVATSRGSASATPPTSASAASRRASSRPPRSGAGWSATGWPSASRCRSTPCRWPRPSTPSPTAASGSTPR
jgi:cell division protein FtsI (penicillin-binding protein 3)